MHHRSPLGSRSFTLAVALLLGTGAVAAPGQEAQGVAQEREQDEAGDAERALRRVLHLRGGQTLRAVARMGAEGWEVKSGNGWSALPAGAVESVVLEREVLAEAKRMERRLGESNAGRVELAGWMIERGLLEEAVAELDRVLERNPLDAAAVALVQSRRLFAVPSATGEDAADARAALISWALGASPTMREAALAELDRVEDREALQAELRASLASNILTRRTFAAQALGRLFPGEELKNLLMLAILDPSEAVRRHASISLSATGEPAVTAPVLRALSSSNPRVRTQAAEALGHMGFRTSVEPLIASLAATSAAQGAGTGRVPRSYVFVGRQFAYIQDFDVEVAQFQAVADPQVNVLLEGSVLETGVHAVTSYGVTYEGKVIRSALGSLTGQNPGYTSKAWLAWWEKNAEEWRAIAKEHESASTR